MTTALSPDERERAFAALLPLAEITADALSRVEVALEDERRLVSPVREGITTSQRAALRGIGRFSYAIRDWGAAIEGLARVRRISTGRQELQNIFMWLLDDYYVLRIKHDIEDVVDPGAATLFSLEPQASSVVVFLTWDTAPDGSVRNIAFATLDEPAWTIPLAELLAAVSGSPQTFPQSPPEVTVRSRHVQGSDDEQASRG